MNNIKLFESKQIRYVRDEKVQKWYFAIVDVVSVLTDSVDSGANWRKLKERLKKEGNETVTNCHSLKMIAADPGGCRQCGCGLLCRTTENRRRHLKENTNFIT